MNAKEKNGKLCKDISFCTRNMTKANDTTGFEENEATSLLSVALGRGRKSASAEIEKVIASVVKEARMKNTHGTCSTCAVARRMDVPWITVYKIVRKVLQFHPYKIIHDQELQHAAKEFFALEFRERVKVDGHWPWNILWTDEGHFYLNEDVSIHNCNIWAKQIHRVMYPVAWYSPRITVWLVWQLVS